MSGSGKSTLAFDLLFAEGQRRFLDSMNVYARQFVEQLARPDVDLITGIPPTVSIEQRTSSRRRQEHGGDGHGDLSFHPPALRAAGNAVSVRTARCRSKRKRAMNSAAGCSAN